MDWKLWSPQGGPKARCMSSNWGCSGKQRTGVSGLRHQILLKDPTWATKVHTDPHFVLVVLTEPSKKKEASNPIFGRNFEIRRNYK